MYDLLGGQEVVLAQSVVTVPSGSLSTSQKFPWLEKRKLIFKVFPDFQSGWEPCKMPTSEWTEYKITMDFYFLFIRPYKKNYLVIICARPWKTARPIFFFIFIFPKSWKKTPGKYRIKYKYRPSSTNCHSELLVHCSQLLNLAFMLLF